MVTLLEKFDEINLSFYDTAVGANGRGGIDDGLRLINSALAYDTEKPIGFGNQPKLFISSDCVNILFAMENYTGADGQEGACKDCVDVLRYLFMKDCRFVDQSSGGFVRGKGCY